MKKRIGIRLAAVVMLLLVFWCGYVVGKSREASPEETFYATITDIQEQRLRVQGLEINDINKRWKFELCISGDTEISWRGIPITLKDLREGDLISVTYAGMIQEISPAVILDVRKIQALGDDLEERVINTEP